MPSPQTFLLPDAGEGLTEAEIVQWHVGVGDTVEVNQTIVEIETAKSLVELPSPFAGTVTQILAPEGTTVEVGAPIIVIDADPHGDAPAPGGQASAAPEADGGSGEGSGSVLVGYGVREDSPRRRRRFEAPDGGAPVAPARAVPVPVA
ncbi:MAG: biotin/lipoyl-containing protein, partial [Cellulomonadaceae bacterium]